MSHPLEHDLALLRRRARRTAVLYGLSMVATTVLVSVVVLGLADYLVRFQDRGLRALASLLAVGLLAAACHRYLYSACVIRLDNVDLARRVERHFPVLKNKLLSAIEFLQQADDPTAGSAVLRRAVVTEAAAASRELKFCELLDLRPRRRAFLLLAGVALLATALLALDPAAAHTALARLVNPFASITWPQRTHLEVRSPVTRVARGQAFEIAVIDARGAPLPSDVRIHYRFEGPRRTTTEEAEPMRFAQGALTARREQVDRPFAYRVDGGDDHSMPWKQVAVVDPPAVAALAIRLIPPPYCGRREESSGRHIRALVGTRVEMVGRASRPIESAVLCFGSGKRVRLQISGDSRDFTVPAANGAAVVVERSGSYWFELADREGLTGVGEHWDIEAVPDAVPTVVIEQPSGSLLVTPQAVVSLRLAAQDDLAIRKISLAFRRTPAAREESLPLYSGPDRPPPRPQSSDTAASPGDRRRVEHRWELASLGLQPGQPLTFWATASDYLGQVARSQPRTLTVITPQVLEERLASRQQFILAELQRALKMQKDCRWQTQSLAARLDQAKALEQADIDRFESLELGQREVDQVLTSGGEALPMHIHSLLIELRNNGLVRTKVQQNMEDLLVRLERIHQRFLVPLGRELTTVGKTLQIQFQDRSGPAPLDFKTIESLAVIGKTQDQATAALEQMLARLSRWDSCRRVQREMEQLQHDQEEVGRDAARLGRRTLGQDLKDLAAPDAAELGRIAQRQYELARRLDHLFQDMERMGESLRSSDRPAAEAVAAARAAGRQLGVNARMQTAAGDLERNRIGQAVAAQKQIVVDLRQITMRGKARQASPSQQALARPSPNSSQAKAEATTGPRPGGQTGKQPAAHGAPAAGSGAVRLIRHQGDLRGVMTRLWGQLPPRAREQILQLPAEDLSPKYKQAIEAYFRRLAEEPPKE